MSARVTFKLVVFNFCMITGCFLHVTIYKRNYCVAMYINPDYAKFHKPLHFLKAKVS